MSIDEECESSISPFFATAAPSYSALRGTRAHPRNSSHTVSGRASKTADKFEIQAKAMAALSHKGAFRNPKTEMLESIDFSRVLRVRDYVFRHYAS
jgi:hypothetical protein